MTLFSFNRMAKRSRCSGGEALAVINRASSAVSTPFVTNTFTSGSVIGSVCASAFGKVISATLIARTRRMADMIFGLSFIKTSGGAKARLENGEQQRAVKAQRAVR